MRYVVNALKREQRANTHKHLNHIDVNSIKHALAAIHNWTFKQIGEMYFDQAIIELTMCRLETQLKK